MDEELQEADVLWPWTDTPSPAAEEGSYLLAALSELHEHDADAVDFSCEPFSGPPASSISSLTSSAQWSESDWSSDGFFLSGPSSAASAGVRLDAAEEFLEADVLWPDTDDDEAGTDDDAAEFWWRCCRRVEEAASAAAAAAAAAACGEREEGWTPLVSSPIDIPMPTRGAAAARRRPSPLSSAVLAVARRRR
ncbi:uncharacterized protein C2845_PM05G31960 [Panicum miliaceum]|uniref:Uncharacterized protein n=1 Tax=Panicum miliaceum TaxID=4540 RepID=A0A3L6SUD8_PANMI|nr:uncharacterized protein C2845_PM05G31960 [Panicum miliaceum]